MLKMIAVRIKQLKTVVLLTLFSFISYFMPKGKYWVICERGTDARDNGWHFYKYMKKEHPQIKIYYVIDKKSADYERVREDAVPYGSLKNYWLVARAERLVSSHVGKFVPYLEGRVKKIFPKIEDRFYFLQHGIISNYIDFLHRKNVRMRLFVCGAKPESDFINEKYGYEEGVVQYTGLARYDSLHDIKTKKQILVMPTWRGYIKTKEDFLKSEYYAQWQGLLQSEELRKLLEEKDFELLFYPHYEVQKYLDCFESPSERIKIASFAEYDVQTLLKESVLLITDYSSVFFDFGYMRKPMIYFHFDAELFFEKHHERGYFDHQRDGFGRVCVSAREVVDELCACFAQDFVLEQRYADRLEAFFPLYDRKNCQRIYEKIIGR